jgi:apolipoprotein N-acyltransferase
MWWPFNFVAALFLAASVHDATPRVALFRGLIAGIFYWLFAATWLVSTVSQFTGLPVALGVLLFLLYCVGQSLMLAVQCYLSARAASVLTKTVAVMLAALVSERYVSAVFAWQFAAPLVDAPWLSQSAEWLTVSGLSALNHGFATSVTGWIKTRARPTITTTPEQQKAQRSARIQLAATSVALAVMTVLGAVRTVQWRARQATAPTLRVALVQPSVAPLVRWDPQAAAEIVERLHRLERDAMRSRPELIVLHEGAYPYVLAHRAGMDGVEGPPVFTQVEAPPIVFGLMSAGDGDTRYNGAFLRNEDGSLSTPVAKHALVPFGESIPFAAQLPWLARLFSLSGGITAGTGVPILTTRAGVRLGILICLEDTLAHSAALTQGSELLVNLTNDAWFVDQTALEEHLLMARWRSIEMRRETVRSVNSGITARIDVLGRVVDRAVPNTQTVLTVNARRHSGDTLAPYTARYGGAIAGLLLAGAIVADAIAQRKKKAK